MKILTDSHKKAPLIVPRILKINPKTVAKTPDKAVAMALAIGPIKLIVLLYHTAKEKRKKSIGQENKTCYDKAMKRLKIISFLLIFVFSLFVAGFVFAERQLEVDYPEAGGLKPETTLFGFPAYVKYIFNLSIIVAGLVAFAAFVFGGIKYITSAGIPAHKKDATEQMFAAFLGLMILLSSYMFLTSINPELTLLAGPEITKYPPEFIETPTLEKETLSYTEIPIGALIQELFLEVRLENLKNFSQKIKDKSKIIDQKSSELNILIAQCACSQLQSQCSSLVPISQAACLAGRCLGDPCNNKQAIKAKRNEINELVNNEEDGLVYWQKKLDREVNGSTEEGDEYIGFRQVYEDLIKAEEMMKKCSETFSSKGKPQFLVAYKDFWVYQQYMSERHRLENFERARPFEYVYLTKHPFELTTFYCSEMIYPVTSVEIDDDLLAELEKEEGVFEGNTICDNEIFLGKDTDSAEELSRRMLVELDNINDNAKKEIINSTNLFDFSNPEQCVISNCSHQCFWTSQQCEYVDHYECYRYDEEGNCLEERPVYKYRDCSYCTNYVCQGTECPGDEPKKTQISFFANNIKENYSQISSSYLKLVNLIQENVDDEFLKISNILKSLRIVQNQITVCHNPKESYIKLEERSEGVVWKEFFTCFDVKEYAVRETPFYDENGKVIGKSVDDCYGKTSENPDFMDNFFCCRGGYVLE